MFSLRKRGKLQFQDNWEGRYRNGRVAVSTIPNYDSMRQATCIVDATQNVLNPPPPNTNCNPARLLLL